MLQFETDAHRLLVSQHVDDLRRDYERSQRSPSKRVRVANRRRRAETSAPPTAVLRRLIVRATARGS